MRSELIKSYLPSLGTIQFLDDVNEVLTLTLPDVGTLGKPASVLHPGVVHWLPILQAPATEEAPPTVSVTCHKIYNIIHSLHFISTTVLGKEICLKTYQLPSIIVHTMQFQQMTIPKCIFVLNPQTVEQPNPESKYGKKNMHRI